MSETCTHVQLIWAEHREGDWPRYRSEFPFKIGDVLRCTTCNEVLTVTLSSAALEAQLKAANTRADNAERERNRQWDDAQAARDKLDAALAANERLVEAVTEPCISCDGSGLKDDEFYGPKSRICAYCGGPAGRIAKALAAARATGQQPGTPVVDS